MLILLELHARVISLWCSYSLLAREWCDAVFNSILRICFLHSVSTRIILVWVRWEAHPVTNIQKQIVYEVEHKESWVLKNWCFWIVVLEKTLESPLDSRKIKPVNLKEINPDIHWKDWCWSGNSNASATWCEELTHWERPWCWERLRAGGEEGNRGWDGWMASPTQWRWLWAHSER